MPTVEVLKIIILTLLINWFLVLLVISFIWYIKKDNEYLKYYFELDEWEEEIQRKYWSSLK